MWLVYFIKSLSSNWYYVGSTNDIDRRLTEHNNGRVRSTKNKRPFVVVYKKEFVNEHEARKHERLLKSKRMDKEKIIRSFNI